MKSRIAWALWAGVLTGCGIEPSIPQYMQDMPRSEEESLRILAEIRKELGNRTQVEQVEGFFFVASNASSRLFRDCKRTVSRVYRYLYKDYFKKKPDKPIRIYLFKDRSSYEAYCKRVYNDPPSTPFGFYMSGERKMVMNIATGTGTLAHELVHPLLAEDFPEVPSWFNEGFASLYEQSGMRDARMVGFVNWRLPGLQKALRAGRCVALRELLGYSADEFYGDHRGVNYAAARYLCYYLQEKDLLRRFYREFRSASGKDPSGLATLEKVTGRKLEDLETTWHKWVMNLRSPR